ncbi:helicase/SNF2 family domain protein [Fulvivirga imtechensis AK7]|uniref:Helicase/SNF2 family domain protein n=1 Tax=Fulvivirga imtechensis AK7 TaxID=1237149 RepID=L8JV00_9BACT|nr:DEAD/DEAH box helicase [Fulvivirga imtechensis]ELR71404.1 helicase/SNF2 family domain protein [Fulvivirga imtechensis AK7]
MKVSAAQPFQIIYSLYEHEYLGYLFESFVVHLDDKGKLTLQHQNISSKNAKEFSSRLDDTDYQLIELMDSMQQDAVIKHFNKKNVKPEEFFLKVYDASKGNEALQTEIDSYLERRRSKILENIQGKWVYEMGNDGEPAWKKIEVLDKKATVLFHFRRNEDNTHYFPTIKYNGEKIDFQYKDAYIICKNPAWMVLEGKLYSFEKDVDGKKLAPFLNKKFIVIPKNVEETYYNKFVAPLIASFDVYAKGFDINTEKYNPTPILTLSELVGNSSSMSLFNDNGKDAVEDSEKILFELSFQYGPFKFKANNIGPVSVSVEKQGDSYTFHRVSRKLDDEKEIIQYMVNSGLPIRNSKAAIPKTTAFAWLDENRQELETRQFIIDQKDRSSKKYFIGEYKISIEVKENIDWFDIHAIIKFGDYEISFKELRKLISKKKLEVELPNGEIAVIPESWLIEYSELFAFSEEDENGEPKLKKHHLALVQDLESGNLAKVTMSRKLQSLKGFDEIGEAELPKHFKGELRPYQKAGYNWLHFLNQYKFGGCLADDMGLGKTVQTLTMLQAQKENGVEGASLLIMPTSLVYNWETEAKKFTPKLKVFTYTGTNRDKDISKFAKYDVIITSYGIVRLDIDLLVNYYFNYVILDESQAIKNPASNIAKAVRKLTSRSRLILTGTPLENSTMDLWSQMHFINPGLLGSQSFFKNEFLNPIEKKNDEEKTRKLNAIIKPFILRRHKSQVATELPEKVENVQYSDLTPSQEQEYEKVKSYYRNKILENIESQGLNKSQLLLLQGLTKLRQIANHPKMVDHEYEGNSGKMEDVILKLDNAIRDDHKILIFSQFVKHLSILADHLKEKHIDFAYLDGSTKDRQGQVERFQNTPELKVFLISLKAGGLGLNLTKADYVFILDPWWNPAIEAQAVDRAHRIGQENKVFTYKFISKNTVEEKILALQKHKRKLASDLITTEESFVKSLSKEDIESLLS